jgi:hypothetical protein
MGPREPFHELAQEPSRRDAAARAAAAVLHVGDVRLVEFAIVIPERQRPRALVGPFARRLHLGDQRLVGAEQPGRGVAQRHHDRPGQRRDVDDARRIQPPGVRERIRQDEPTLGVGVDDLDRLAQVARHHVARLDRRT